MIDQIATDLKQLPQIDHALKTRSGVEAAAWTSATESEAKVGELEKKKEKRRMGIGRNKQNIALWTRQIEMLQGKIATAEQRNAELLSSDDSEIDKELKFALEFLEEARQLETEVAKLKLDKTSCETHLELLKSKYLKMKDNRPF